jgi:hypothetical protein
MSARNLAVAMAAVGLFAACGDDEHVDPVGGGGGGTTSSGTTSTVTGSSSATAVSSGAGGEGAGAPIRTLIQRDPFGNVAETRNLLWDGDFEWESSFADQYGWLQGQTANVASRRVGPECRSGLKCGVLGPDLIGIAVSSAEHDLYASVWVRPADGSCESVTAYLLAEGIYDDGADVVIPPVTGVPDESGWCHHEATVPQRDDKSYLYLASTAVAEALVDDAVVREATSDEARRVVRYAAWVPSAAVFEKLEAARGVIRKWRGPHEGAPDPTREALLRAGRGEGTPRFVASPRVHRGGPR